MTREKALLTDNQVIALFELGAISVSNINSLINKIYDDFELRTCDSCKLQYDKYCPVAETNHDFKHCSEWEQK